MDLVSLPPPDDLVTVARAHTPHGDVALRRRGSVLELVVNGAFAMDTVDTSTEVELARATLAAHHGPQRVLVGGLGLGFTARAVLADPRVRCLDVVELAAPLVQWAGDGLVEELAGLESDGRCRLWASDVADALAGLGAGPHGGGDPGAGGPRGPWDLVLLDVDNGPGFLVHSHNERLYDETGLATATRALAPGGCLVVWSSHPAPELLEAMRRVAEADAPPGARASGRTLRIEREGRAFDYALYQLTLAPAPPSSSAAGNSGPTPRC